MGVYDSVMVPCPECGHREEFQSKGSGNAYLRRYNLGEDNIPDDVLGDVDRHNHAVCGECGTHFEVRVARVKPVVTVVRSGDTEDDQLREDLDRVTRRTMRQTHEGLTQQDDEDFLASERLRAAAGLDQEDE